MTARKSSSFSRRYARESRPGAVTFVTATLIYGHERCSSITRVAPGDQRTHNMSSGAPPQTCWAPGVGGGGPNDIAKRLPADTSHGGG